MFTFRIFAPLFIHGLVHGSFVTPWWRHDLRAPVKNAVCEAKLDLESIKGHGETLRRLRQFRFNTLSVPAVAPGYARNLRMVAPPTPPQFRELAAHLHGIEDWQDQADDHRTNASTVTGRDATAQYFRRRDLERQAVQNVVTNLETDLGLNLFVIFRNVLGLSVLTIPGIGIDPVLIPAYLAFDPVASLGWRSQHDARLRASDQVIRHFIERPFAEQKLHWAFASREYRVSRRTIEALWSCDPQMLTESLKQDLVESTWWLRRFALNPLADVFNGRGFRESFTDRFPGTVIFDQLARINEKDEPELINVVRTSARLWARIPAPRAERPDAGPGLVPALKR